jgi:hypothetical protein
MARHFMILICVLMAAAGCTDSSTPGTEGNLEGRWSCTITNDSDHDQTFTAYIDQHHGEYKVYLDESTTPLDGNGNVSNGVFDFSWHQNFETISLFATLSTLPPASLTAAIEDGGNFMEGTVMIGYPLTEKIFIATRIDSEPIFNRSSKVFSPHALAASPDDYTSVCSDTYAKIIPTIPDTPPANPSSTVTIGGAQCLVSGNSETGISAVQNAAIVTHPVDTNVLFPGAILDGSELLSSDEMLLMDAGRSSGVLQLSDVNVTPGEDNFIETEGPVTAFSVQQAISQLTPKIASSASVFNAHIYTSDSSTSLAVDLGVGFEAEQIEASGSFSFDWSVAQNFATYYGTQAFYTINFVTPADPDTGLFDRKLFFSEDTDTCSYLTNKDNPPVYISSVTYGKMFLATAQGMHSAVDIEEALDIAANTGEAGATITSGLKVSDVLNTTEITYSVYGGSGSSVSQSLAAANGNDMVLAWFNLIKDQNSAEYSIDNPGVPIFYTLKNVVDHTVVQLPYAVSFDSRHCQPAPPSPPKKYLYRFDVSSRSGEEVNLCIGNKYAHSLLFNNQHNWALWDNLADFLDGASGDTEVFLYTDTYQGGKSYANMKLYMKSNQPGSTWGKIWHRNFSTNNYAIGTGQYAKSFTLNTDGTYSTNADPIYFPLITSILIAEKCF